MKCLSVCQPFAELIIEGKKTIELRKWNTKFRGEFLVHAAKKILKEDCKRMKISSKTFPRVPTLSLSIYDKNRLMPNLGHYSKYGHF